MRPPIPEPVPHTIEDHSDEEPPADDAAPKMVLADMESVPTPVHDDDGGREPSENFESVSGVHDFEDEGRGAAASRRRCRSSRRRSPVR